MQVSIKLCYVVIRSEGFSVLASLEMKQKLYGSILIIGGGFAFPGAANMLQARLELKPMPIFSRSTNNIEVFSNPRVSSFCVVIASCGIAVCITVDFSNGCIIHVNW